MTLKELRKEESSKEIVETIVKLFPQFKEDLENNEAQDFKEVIKVNGYGIVLETFFNNYADKKDIKKLLYYYERKIANMTEYEKVLDIEQKAQELHSLIYSDLGIDERFMTLGKECKKAFKLANKLRTDFDEKRLIKIKNS